NVSEGLSKIGINSHSVVSGKNKAMGDPLEPAKEEHFAILQGMVDEFYGTFRARVIERRAAPRKPIDKSRLEDLTDGRILTGRQAHEAGLVDEIGGIHEAFAQAKQLAGIKAARLVKYYREDMEIPRTAYAPTAAAPGAGGTEINLLQIRAESLSPLSGWEGGGAYYLWIPPG